MAKSTTTTRFHAPTLLAQTVRATTTAAIATICTVSSSSAQLPDVGGDPHFGTVTLSAGFTPDPHELFVSGGGYTDVRAADLGDGCRGFVSSEPDVRLFWRGGGTRLQIYFDASAYEGDPTLVVNLPDGSWACDDDSGDGLNPNLTIFGPAAGRYEIWVGTYEEGEGLVDGRLGISELVR